MSRNGETGALVNRSQVARIIFNAAAANGISDRETIDKLTSQVIARLERPAVLPGMEDLVPPGARPSKTKTSDADILAMVKEFLATSKPALNENESLITRVADPALPEMLPPVAIPKEKIMPEEKTEKITTQREIKREVKAMPTRTKAASISTSVELTANALRVLEKRYLMKDKQGKVIETPPEMFHRVAQVIAQAESLYNPKADIKFWEDRFYQLMARLEFLPNSPTLMNAGRELGQLSACFVLPIEDSMESIFEAVKNTALIHKSGGGTGFSFSRLRPERDRVGSTGGVASGPVSFMRAFDVATDVIKQGGTRRGANMALLSVTHPDILRFISAKEDMTSLTNFNISVAVTAQFMEAVKENRDYNLINPHNGETVGKLNARDVFNKMVELAWKTGDPGVVFIDRINRDNPTPELGHIESTNPCGEQPLLPYESCNLGSINLSRMLITDHGQVSVDYEKLGETVRLAVRFLDNVIDVNKFPLPQIAEMTRQTRKIGLGVMGFADMLIQLGIPYDSEQALKTAQEVMGFINTEAHKTSEALAGERGVFPAYPGSIYDRAGGPRMRNASCTTIAPTGTISLIADCSNGIEPIYGLVFVRRVLAGRSLLEVNPWLVKTAKDRGFYSEALIRQLASGTSLADIEDAPTGIKRLFATAPQIGADWHVRMQAVFQRNVDNAVSKTVNLPRDATPEDVAKVYLSAFREGLKGITIYRDQSRKRQPLGSGKVNDRLLEKWFKQH
jgi:ribonucleoside-diphosphate reductase alpha chain